MSWIDNLEERIEAKRQQRQREADRDVALRLKPVLDQHGSLAADMRQQLPSIVASLRADGESAAADDLERITAEVQAILDDLTQSVDRAIADE